MLLRALLPIIVAAIALSACTDVVEEMPGEPGDGRGGDGGAAKANIYGVVETTGFTPVSGCSVKAYDLDGTTALMAATSDSSGKYTLSSDTLTPGTPYKIIAECGATDKFAAIQFPDLISTSSKPAATLNTASTLVATQVAKAAFGALEAAVNGQSSGQAAIKASVKKQIGALASQLIFATEDALAKGVLTAPTMASASAIAAKLATADSLTAATDAENEYIGTDANHTATKMPTALKQAVSAATISFGSSATCDSSLSAQGIASVEKCAASLASYIYSLGYSLLIDLSAAGPLNGKSCDEVGLDSFFPQAAYTPNNESSGFCYVRHLVARPNRNAVFEDPAPNFESFKEIKFKLGTDGIITKLADATFNKHQHSLNDIDKMLFGYDAGTTAGLNIRLFQKMATRVGHSFSYTYNYLDSSDTWSVLLCNHNVDPQDADVPCSPRQTFGSFSTGAWTSAGGNVAAQAAAVTGGNFVGKVMSTIFKGDVPSAASIEKLLDARKHVPRNISGPRESTFLFTHHPLWIDANDTDATICGDSNPASPCANGCFDGDPSTACYDVDRTAPAKPLRVDLDYEDEPGLSGARPINKITASSTGKYYMRPVMNNGTFSGIFDFINTDSGEYLMDEMNRIRYGFYKTSGLFCPGGVHCTDGLFYTAYSRYSCSPSCTRTFELVRNIYGTPTVAAVQGFSIPTETTRKSRYLEFNSGGQRFGWNLIAVGPLNNDLPYFFEIGVDTSNGLPISLSYGRTHGLTPATGKYFIGIKRKCSALGASCPIDSLFLVDGNGEPLRIPALASTTATDSTPGTYDNGELCWYSSGTYTCGSDDVVKWTLGLPQGASGQFDWDADFTNALTSFHNATQYPALINQGPFANSRYRCNTSPYYVETGVENNKLDCNSGNTATANGDVAFDSIVEYQMWAARPANASYSSRVMKQNLNGYVYEDPATARALFTNAYSDRFTGFQKIDDTSKFTSPQAFALIQLFTQANYDSDGLVVSGLMPADPNASLHLLSPAAMRNGGGNNLLNAYNQLLGNAFSTFKQ